MNLLDEKRRFLPHGGRGGRGEKLVHEEDEDK